jgi:serine/threonine protein kinase
MEMPRTFAQLPGYEVTSRIGRGAGAIIYEARERASRRAVAIKHIVRQSPKDDRFIEQAETEYQVAHALDHPYLRKCLTIIRVRRWLKTRELFLVLELVRGERLDNRGDLHARRRGAAGDASARIHPRRHQAQ